MATSLNSKGGDYNFLFTEKLKFLHNMVDTTGQKLDIAYRIIEEHEMLDPAICIMKRDNNNIPYIEIGIKEGYIKEDIVSHELLHALNIKRGFGNSSSNSIGEIPFKRISNNM